MPRTVRNASSALALLVFCYFLEAYQKPDKVDIGKSLPAGENLLWSDPGDVARLDFVNGAGGVQGVPSPPFQFEAEDMGGTNPKVKIRDAKGRAWSVKFGEEAKPSVLATRIVWACGYFVETEYFITHGQIQGVKDLKRARTSIQEDGAFADARFQLRASSPKFLDSANWTWSSNPFLGTPQLNGLRVLVMLVSNWDTKDARDRDAASHSKTADSNLAIFERPGNGKPRYEFMVSDWGASFGKWGSTAGHRSKFNCKDYQAQTPDFIRGTDNDVLRWGFAGKHTDDITNGIRVSDVRWLLQYLGKISDLQLRRGLASSGATPDEMDCFLRSIRDRIEQLRRISSL